MSTLACGVLVSILFIAFIWWFRTRRTQPLFVRVIVPVVLIAVGVVSAIWAFSTPGDVNIRERLRVVGSDRALSAIPSGTTFRGGGGDDCPDAYGGPYYNRRYSYEGTLDAVFKFYDERLKEAGWKRLTVATTSPAPSTTTTTLPVPTSNSTTTSISPPLPPGQGPSDNHARTASYSKSYGSWKARATVSPESAGALRPLRLFTLFVTVAEHPTRACTA